ncbi:MAG: LptA/OstA family protein, partial [bacterium]
MNPRAAMAAAAILVGLAAPAAAAQTGPVEVTGATRVEIDEASGLWHLTGSPVTIRRGRVVLRAPKITYDTKRQVVEATGGVSYAEPGAEFASAAAKVWLAEERLAATGGVTGVLSGSDGETRLRADRVEASRARRQMTATGSVTLTRSGMTLTGARVDYDETRQHAAATGQP